MARYGIVIDTSRCMECYNCFMACKDEHCGFATSVSESQPHTGQHWIRVQSHERGDNTLKMKTANAAIPCMHCADAPCQKAATGGAVYRREDGIVIIDPKKAKGQDQIVKACPVGAVYWNEELQLPQKCTMCAHLLDEGFAMPRCVEACPNEAMYFGDLDDPNSEVNQIIAKNRVTLLDGVKDLGPNVIHLNIPTVFLAGSVYLPDDEVADGALIRLTRPDSGEVRETRTNYFGDWEFEWLEKGAKYLVEIRFDGYEAVELEAVADTDHFLGELVLTPISIKA